MAVPGRPGTRQIQVVIAAATPGSGTRGIRLVHEVSANLEKTPLLVCANLPNERWEKSVRTSEATGIPKIVIPKQVNNEIEETAAYDDPSRIVTHKVLTRQSEWTNRAVNLDENVSLDNGGNAAVTLANELGASQLLYENNSILRSYSYPCGRYSGHTIPDSTLVDSSQYWQYGIRSASIVDPTSCIWTWVQFAQ